MAAARSASRRSAGCALARRPRTSPGAPRAAADAAGGLGEDDAGERLRREYLLRYVREVQPQLMEQFVAHAPEEVVGAMRQTVTNMLGTLPAQFFEVTVTSTGENLAQLLYSVMLTGYLFRNAQTRLDLRASVDVLTAGDASEALAPAPRYAPGTQRSGVEGQVLRWNEADGVQATDAEGYMDELEMEVERLREQVAALKRGVEGQNELLEYLKTLEPANLQELTSSASTEVMDAMNAFVARLVGSADATELRELHSETTSMELARLLSWVMVVGYSLRTIEVRFEMQRTLGVAPSMPDPAELPPPA